MKDLKDRADGNAIAAKEALGDAREARERLTVLEARTAAAEKELEERKNARELTVKRACKELDFVIGGGVKTHKTFDAVFYLLSTMVLGFFVYYITQEDLVFAGIVGIIWIISWMAYIIYYPSQRTGKHFKFVCFAASTVDMPDMRPDSNALQRMKHKDGLTAQIDIENLEDGEKKHLVVSMEMLAQLTAPKFMTLAADDKVALARIVRAAESYQLVNFDRYVTFTGRSVPMATAVVAWALWKKQQEDDLLDFLGAPQL